MQGKRIKVRKTKREVGNQKKYVTSIPIHAIEISTAIARELVNF